MQFSCEKVQLLSAITITGHVASSRSTVPALEGLLLQAQEEGGLFISGYDLKTGIRTKIPAEVTKPGDIVLNAKLLGDIIRRLSDEIVVFSVGNDYLVTITCGQSTFDIIGIPGTDYPALPSVNEEQTISVPQNMLKQMISETKFAISDDESRPIHTGSLFEMKDQTLTIVSVDGYRLALRREALENQTVDCQFVVPGGALGEVEKIVLDSDDFLTIKLDTKHILFTIGETTVISRRLEGEFLNYKQAIPQTNTIYLTVDKKQLLSAVERVSLIINEKLRSPVRCMFGDDVLTLATATALGKANDTCPVTGDGGGLEIGFNNKYLIDALRAASVDEVKISLGTAVSPCIISPLDSDGGEDITTARFVYLVLPVRLV